jgi:hypothetical protein
MRPLILLSPAKTLNFEAALSPALAKAAATAPHYVSEAHTLADSLGTLSKAELGKLMSLSASLASLNHARFADFTAQPTRIAAAAFEGPAYKGLDAASLESEQLGYLQVYLAYVSPVSHPCLAYISDASRLYLSWATCRARCASSARLACISSTSPSISPISPAGLAAHPVRRALRLYLLYISLHLAHISCRARCASCAACTACSGHSTRSGRTA